MLRKLLVLLAALATTLGLMMVPTATTASAFDNEWLGCSVSGGVWYHTSPCNGGLPSGSVIVEFKVMDMTTPSTSSWTVPTEWAAYISSGCTSGSTWCHFTFPTSLSREITVWVTLTQNGATKTLTTSASIDPDCGWC